MYKQIIQAVVVLALLVGIFFTGRLTKPDNYKMQSDTLFMPVDSTSIICNARLGYTSGTIAELEQRFGKIYLDTNRVNIIQIKDSLNIKDSIIYVQKLLSDTTKQFTLTDSTTNISTNFDLRLKTTAYFHPVYQIQNDITISRFSIIGLPQRNKWKWYDQFYIGVGYPGFLQVGYGVSLGNIRTLITY